MNTETKIVILGLYIVIGLSLLLIGVSGIVIICKGVIENSIFSVWGGAGLLFFGGVIAHKTTLKIKRLKELNK